MYDDLFGDDADDFGDEFDEFGEEFDEIGAEFGVEDFGDESQRTTLRLANQELGMTGWGSGRSTASRWARMRGDEFSAEFGVDAGHSYYGYSQATDIDPFNGEFGDDEFGDDEFGDDGGSSYYGYSMATPGFFGDDGFGDEMGCYE